MKYMKAVLNLFLGACIALGLSIIATVIVEWLGTTK